MSEQFPIEFGRYNLIDRLAVGGMAELFLAEVKGAHGFQKTVVIKRILPHLASDPQFTSMFIDEAKLTARLSHPKIAQTYELGHHEGQLFIAMEFVDGVDTLAMLRECAHRQVRMPTDIAVHIVTEVLDALDFAHNEVDESGELLGIVHRDVSPSNVLVSKRGDVKLVDFGIAQALQDEQRTQAGTLKGKYGYMSPEQILGGAIDGRSDLFSVGIVLAEMLMGRRLFAAPTELDVLLMVRDVDLARLDRYGGHIEPDLMAIVRRALQKRPEDRHEDAAAFREALGDWLFENRLRVNARRVGEFVLSLYEDAWARKRSALADKEREDVVAEKPTSGAGAEAAQRAAGGGEPAAASAVVDAGGDRGAARADAPRAAAGEMPGGQQESAPGPGLIAGIPEGSAPAPFPSPDSGPEIHIDAEAPSEAEGPSGAEALGGAEGGSEAEARGAEAPPLAVRNLDPEAAVAGAAAREGGVPEAIPIEASSVVESSAQASSAQALGAGDDPLGPELDLDEALHAELGLELEELELAEPGAPDAEPSGREPARAVEDAAPSPAEEAGAMGGESGGASAAVPLEVSEADEVSLRFSSIEAAVSSVSRAPQEPAVREFDGSDLSESPPRPEAVDPRGAESAEDASPPVHDPASLQSIDAEPDSRGEFADTSALHVLYRLAIAEASGLLVVEVGGIRKDIYVQNGDPEFVSSNVASELFGNYLVSQQVLSSGELDMALAMMPRYGGKLGDTLVGLGLMKPLDVFRHLSRQVRDKLIDVCTWERGLYAYYEAYQNPRESFPLDIDSFQVIGAGAMAFPERAILQWAERAAHARPRAVSNPYVKPEQFGVAEWTRPVRDVLAGEQTLWELAGRYTRDADRLNFLRALRLFVECDLAELKS